MNTNKKRNIRTSILLILSSFIAGHIFLMFLPNVFEVWNLKAIDQLFLFRSNSKQFKPHYDETIVHADLNNTSIQQLNNFYLNRSHYAQVVRNLSAMKVAAQMYDFIFAAPSDSIQDKALIKAVSDAEHVYFGLAFELADQSHSNQKTVGADKIEYLGNTGWKTAVIGDLSGFYVGKKPLITFPSLASVSKGLGYLSINCDPDGVFRRVPLLVRYGSELYPSFPFRVICDYLNVPPERIIVEPGKSIILKDARRPGGSKGHDIIIPIDRYGNMRVNFIGPWGRMKHYNFFDVLRASEDRDELEMWGEELSGKIVLVSDVTTGSSDIGPVPTDTNFPLSGLHANTMNTILSGSFLNELSNKEMLLIELMIMFILLVFSIRFSSLPFSIGSIILAISYLALVSLLFLHCRIILHIIRPLLMTTFAAGSILIYRYISEEKEKSALKNFFEAYFPPSIVKKLMADPKAIAAKGEKKELTILFSDIKNFTGYSSSLAPDRVQQLLNEYFEAMTEIVFKYEGTVDKFIGDGLMVFFGDPEPQPDHAIRCVKSAIEMQAKVREIRKKWESRGDMPIRIRIGINTGDVFVGNMGSMRRLSYTVIGAAANLAQRLESNAPVGGIMISERTHDLIKDQITAEGPKKITAKGFDEPVIVYEVSMNQEESHEKVTR